MKVSYEGKNGESKTKYIPSQLSSYFYYFLKGKLSRECCYSCPFSGKKRAGDITLGDCWGVEVEYPNLLKENNGSLDTYKGVSVVLVNSEKGKKLIDCVSHQLVLNSIDFNKVKKYNKNLAGNHVEENDKQSVQKVFECEGYSGIEKLYRNELGMRYYKMILASFIPQTIKNGIKNILATLRCK